MKISTFEDDLLGLEDFSKRLQQFINIESRYVEGSLVVGLSSKFGTGKSSFLQMWMSSLNNSVVSAEKPLVILLNAWESDYYGDPLFAIISALAKCFTNENKSTAKLIDAAKDFGWFATAVGGQVVKKMTGIDAVAAGELAENKNAKRNDCLSMSTDTFSMYEGRKNAMASLKEAIQDLVEGSEPKVLFLVDELDRCRPDYAISYLETIKHIFDVKGAVFLLAADRQHLENSAKTAFGAQLDFDEYYRKFVHREVVLPDISDENYEKIASKYVKYYLEHEGSRTCFMALDRYRVENIAELVGALKLTPRQIQEVFRILGHIFETTENNKGRLLWGLAVGSIMMAVFKIGKSDIFHLLGTKQLKPEEAFDFFKKQLKIVDFDWWFILCLTGGGLKVEKDEKHEDIMKRVGLLSENAEFNSPRELGEFFSAWGHRTTNRFVQIHEKIEQLQQWN